MKEESHKVLEMLEQGKINAEQAGRLLSSIEEPGEVETPLGKKPRWLKVKVWDKDAEKPKVNVKVPIALLKAGIKIGAIFQSFIPDNAKDKIAEKGIDISQIENIEQLDELINSLTESGPFVIAQVEDTDDNERVEVTIE